MSQESRVKSKKRLHIFSGAESQTIDHNSESLTLIKWGPVAAVVAAVITYLLPQIIVGSMLSIYPAIKHWSDARATDWLNNSTDAQFVYTVVVEAMAVLLIWLFLRHYRAKFSAIGLKRAKLADPLYALMGFAAYMVLYLGLAAVLTQLIPAINPNQQQDIGFQHATGMLPLAKTFVSLVLLPPLAEEIIFRGFVFTGFRRKFGFIVSALATSVLFATPHLIEGTGGGLLWIAGVDTFVLSCVLCFLREKTGRLWAGMGVHALKNGIAFATIFILHAH